MVNEEQMLLVLSPVEVGSWLLSAGAPDSGEANTELLRDICARAKGPQQVGGHTSVCAVGSKQDSSGDGNSPFL